MSKADKIRKFLLSLQGHRDQFFTIEEVQEYEARYELLVSLSSRRDPNKRNALDEQTYIVVYNEADRLLRVGLGFFLGIPATRLEYAQVALNGYQPRGSTFAYLLKVFDGEDDISMNVSFGILVPRALNRDSKPGLRNAVVASLALLQTELFLSSQHIYASLGLPPTTGEPTWH